MKWLAAKAGNVSSGGSNLPLSAVLALEPQERAPRACCSRHGRELPRSEQAWRLAYGC